MSKNYLCLSRYEKTNKLDTVLASVSLMSVQLVKFYWRLAEETEASQMEITWGYHYQKFYLRNSVYSSDFFHILYNISALLLNYPPSDLYLNGPSKMDRVS